MSKRTEATCNDCYFRRAGLCALPGDTPCPTFRLAAAGALEPPRSHASSPVRRSAPQLRRRVGFPRRWASPRDEFERSWQPRLWITLGLLILIGAYLIAFVVGNDEEASVDFVFGEARTSLIWVILLSLLAGLIGGVLLSQLHRRRQRAGARRGSRRPRRSPTATRS